MRLLLLALLLATTASAQDSTATGWIAGTVTDAETVDPLLAATVWLVDTTTGAATDIEGRFSVEVPAGTHTVRASYVGYQSAESTVTVRAGETVRFDPALGRAEIIECWVCVAPSVVLPGVYAARVATFVDQPGWCEPVRAGDQFAVDR